MIKTMILNKYFSRLFCLVALAAIPSCRKFVNAGIPQTQTIRSAVFQDNATALSALQGLYSEMMNSTGFASGSNSSVTLLAGSSADEFNEYTTNSDRLQFNTNDLLPTNTLLENSLWGECYKYIYQANSIVEGVSHSTSLSSEVRNQLTGESKFIRAFCYFYLIHLFGPVPLVLTTDYRINQSLSRGEASEVVTQMIADLKEAEKLLLPDFSTGGGERIRPNRGAAQALLARIYLYLGNWKNAEDYATQLIKQSDTYQLESDLSRVFLKNSREAIWQLRPVVPGINSWEGYTFIFTSFPNFVALTNSFLQSFEPLDKRRIEWIDSTANGSIIYYFPFKYKIQTGNDLNEYSMVLRLAEQLLIRAEAYARQDKMVEAQADLNAIRTRAGLPNTTAMTQSDLLAAIEQERKIELFSEWGHRWLDLKRLGHINTVLGTSKPDWQARDSLYPIPQPEIQNDPHLNQNPGY
ncbi:MAG: RagB/SusD family nutrient uptake outer membrane protein [Flavisolibacter sp.]